MTASVTASAASFQGNAQVHADDSSGSLSWNTTTKALTVMCWFKLTIPTDAILTDNMTLLVNQHDYAPGSPYAYLLQFNTSNGNIEFVTQGDSRSFTTRIIERPYLERWYHVAIVRSDDTYSFFVDGRAVTDCNTTPPSVGNSTSTGGLTVGGWGNGRFLYGEVEEVAIHQAAVSRSFVADNLFQDQSGISSLTGYYKLRFSTNPETRLKNFAPNPASGTGGAVTEGSGKVGFDETNQGGEQSAFDSRKNGGRDALAPLSGTFTWEHGALSRPTPGVPFHFGLGFSSANAFGGFKLGSTDPFDSGPLGPGWRHTFETRLLPAQDFDPGGGFNVIGLMSWNGAIETWDLDFETAEFHTRHNEYRGELTQLNLTQLQWVTPDRMIYLFRNPNLNPQVMRGRLLEIRDYNSNAVQLRWDQTIGVITQVVDSVRGIYEFKHNAQQLLTNVTFGAWSVNFAYDANKRLISKSMTGPSAYTNVNTTWQFGYSDTRSNLLERVVDPRGNTNITVFYDKYGRVTNRVDALGLSRKTEYVSGQRQIITIDEEGQRWTDTFDRRHRPLAHKDPLENVTSTTYDNAGNRNSVTEPLGYKTLFAYDGRANVIAQTNALREITRRVIHPKFNKPIQETDPNGWTTDFVYDDERGNLLRQYDNLGTIASHSYLPNGLLAATTNANGNVTRFGYNTDGLLISERDEADFASYFGYNELGWKTSETNALGEVTTFAFDLNGNVVRTEDALHRVYLKVFDELGNPVKDFDANGQLALSFFDAANQRTQMVDRAGSVWKYDYTPRGQLSATIDPLGNTTTNIYDAVNRRMKDIGQLGSVQEHIYDANGNETVMVDNVGQRWIKTFDRLNRVIVETDPLGNIKRTAYDSVGQVKEITTPQGFTSTHFYDGRGRLTKWVDAAGFEWKYDYDATANITNITDALNGHYVMEYSPRNERTLERNQDGFEWRYEYDAVGRLSRQIEPRGTIRSLSYDTGGRLTNVVFNTGRINALTYDPNNNPTELTRIQAGVPTSTLLVYDAMDRVISTSDANAQTVQYAYDALGRATNVVYPTGNAPGVKTLLQRFDALGRLTNQMDWASRQMSYAYDEADRLVTRTFPNGITQTNSFDSAGRQTGLSYGTGSSPLIALTYAYDRNGNKSRSTETGTLRWPKPSLTGEKAGYTKSGRLKTRTIERLPSPGGEGQGGPNPSTINYSYDASGNMTNATGGGQSWGFTYDEDNRVLTVKWDCGTTAKNIANRYDALGRRIVRTMDGSETKYVLNLTGDMERILCDLNPDGTFTYYIHGLDLSYKVGADGNVTCFLADAQANIIATTDSHQSLSSLYAYTPYGRNLGSTNFPTTLNPPPATDTNPYRFVGSQGVMEELPDLYFMRARYYSATAGLFLSTDPVKSIGPSWKPDLYAYANGNPLSYADPKGEFFWLLATPVIAKIVIGAAIGAAVGASFDIAWQTLVEHRSFTGENRIQWGRVLGSAVGGAVTGGIVGSPLASISTVMESANGNAIFTIASGESDDQFFSLEALHGSGFLGQP